MPISRPFAFWFCAALAVLAPQLAAAQTRPPCPPAPRLEATSISVDTKTALDVVNKMLGKVGIDINFKNTRDSILKDNPRADQVVIVLTMANSFCEMIWSDKSLSGADKAAKFQAMMQDMLARALGPAPVARTDAPRQGRFDAPGGPSPGLLARAPMLKFVADYSDIRELPQPRTGFLRDAPFYVTDANRYFVIVGSAPTREDGIRLMDKLKSKAPQRNFALYGPYGSNTSYGVMMASWVPRDVASEALRVARQEVAKDAFLWACRSSGESC